MTVFQRFEVFLDFGKSFSRRAKFFEEYINPRTSNGIVDFITMGLVPDIACIYRDDLLALVGRKKDNFYKNKNMNVNPFLYYHF